MTVPPLSASSIEPGRHAREPPFHVERLLQFRGFALQLGNPRIALAESIGNRAASSTGCSRSNRPAALCHRNKDGLSFHRGGIPPRNEGTVMTKIQALVVSAALAIAMAAPVSAATSDPEVVIYRFPGVRDDGSGPNSGLATVFSCTNFSGATDTIRFVPRANDGALLGNTPFAINHLQTLTVATKSVVAYIIGALPPTGFMQQGTMAIAATSTNMVCTAMTIDAANAIPTFAVPLHGIRFSPAPGSQE
jgi:hypothetical protein